MAHWIIRTGIIVETLLTEIGKLMYEDLSSKILQWKNISVEFVEIEKKNFQRTLDEESPENVDWLYFPCDMTLFSANRLPNSPRISLPATPTSLYMISVTPSKKTVPSLKFLQMQFAFVIYLLASLIIISALMSVINGLVRRGVSTPREFGVQFLDNLWRTSLLFFFEPFIRTPRILSWRILASAWLIAISFIYIDLCSHLKSKFTETEYNYVDTVENLPRDRYRDVIVVKNYVAEEFINRMAETDENYRQMKKQMRRMEEEYFLFNSFSNFMLTNPVLIVNEFLVKIVVKELNTLFSEALPRGLVAFSEPLYSTFVVFPIARNASSKTVNAINDFCLLQMESKIMANYFNEMDFLFYGLKWTKPLETFQDLTFGDIKSVLDLFFYGSLLAGLIFFVEFWTALRETFNFSSRRRQP